MLQRVDIPPLDTKLTGFSYINKDSNEECVLVTHPSANGNVVVIQADSGSGYKESVFLHVSDVPNMIKALQAAYDHKTKG